MRGSLFIKVFLGFWLVILAIVFSWNLTENYFQSQPRAHPPGPEHMEGPPQRFMLRLIYRLQTAPDPEIPSLVREVKETHGIDVYLLDRSGTELTGRTVPPELVELAARLEGRRRRVFAREGGRPMAAHEIHRREQGIVRVALLFPEKRHRLIGALIDSHRLRVLIALLISGLVCYGLSRLLTRRLSALQRAAGKIAAGDLDARLQVRERGGDETDALARDFNEMAEQLQARMRAQKQLLSDVSHELRSPLARIRVALALAQDAEEKRQDYLDRMEHETERLEALIQQLLSSQQSDPELDTHIDLVALLQTLCADASFEGAAEGKAVQLDTALEQAIVASSGDLLHRAFDNILRNALRHTKPQTTVSITLRRDGDQFLTDIEDRGPGLPEDELENIFEAFYRVEKARTPGDGNQGLGLAIVRHAIRIHGGQVAAGNTGKGLRISVRLPAGG